MTQTRTTLPAYAERWMTDEQRATYHVEDGVRPCWCDLGQDHTAAELNARDAQRTQPEVVEGDCSMCSPGHNRGDGRCGRHGKLIVINEFGLRTGQQIRLTVDRAGFFRDDTSEIITRDAGAVLTYDGIDQGTGWPRVHRATTMHDGVTWCTGLGREMFEPVGTG